MTAAVVLAFFAGAEEDSVTAAVVLAFVAGVEEDSRS
jgi:hypothetical protein